MRLSTLGEVRRLITALAGGLFLVAIAFPLWRITLRAPQYPGQDLIVSLYAYPRLGGDFEEVQALNAYVGFYYPDPVFVQPNYVVHDLAIAAPEWTLGPAVFVLAGLACLSVATFVSDNSFVTWIPRLLAGLVVVFVGMIALAQYRLHQAGHSLDPGAPLRGVDAFTPPVLGTYEVANISGTAWIGTGGYLVVAAVVLLGIAVAVRHRSTTVFDVGRAVRAKMPAAVDQRDADTDTHDKLA